MAAKKSTDMNAMFKEFATPIHNIEELYVKTGVIPFDLLTGGRGIPWSRMLHFFSENGVGKSTCLYTLARSLCNMGQKVIWAASEPSEKLAYDMGLLSADLTPANPNFQYVVINFYNDLERFTNAFLGSEYNWLFIDSITNVSPSAEAIKDKSIEDASMGLEARILTPYIKWYSAYLTKCPKKGIIFITQMRNQIETGWGKTTKKVPAGPEALKYNADLRWEFKRLRFSNASDSQSKVKVKDSYYDGTEGFFIAEKSRHADPGVKIPATVIFGKGLSEVTAMQEYFTYRGFLVPISGGGVDITWGGETTRLDRSANAYDWCKEHGKEIMDDFYSEGHAQEYFRFLQQGGFEKK